MKYLLFATLTIFPALCVAGCTDRACTAVVERIYMWGNPDNDIQVQLQGIEDTISNLTVCVPNPSAPTRFKLDLDHQAKDEIYSAALTSLTVGLLITLRVTGGSSGCEIAYVYLRSTTG